MSYETIDTIADALIPIAVAIWLIFVINKILKSSEVGQIIAKAIMALSLCLLWVYGWMFTDKFVGIWRSVGLDYSTHTAFACATTFLLVLYNPFKNGTIFYFIFLLSYCALMLYQRYHTLADILSTGLFTGAGLALINAAICKRWSNRV